MRRRRRDDVPPPPDRLLVFDPADWLPGVDPAGYDPDQWRDRRDGLPVGEPSLGFDEWRLRQARSVWVRERLDWCRGHGWPGGLTVVDLLREEWQQRMQSRGGLGS